MPAWFCAIQANSEWYRVNELFRVISNVCLSHILHENQYHPCCFIFHLAFSLEVLTKLAAKLYSLYFVICLRWLHRISFQNSKAWLFQMQKLTRCSLKCFCGSWLLQIQNQQATLWNYLAPCKWSSAIATLLPTRLGENHWHAVSTCKWLLRVATKYEHRVKISLVWVTAAIWFFWGHVWRYCRLNLT